MKILFVSGGLLRPVLPTGFVHYYAESEEYDHVVVHGAS